MLKKATAGIIWKDGQILIAQRAKDALWEFPGGKIDPGETPEACLVREIKEELNMTIKVEHLFMKVDGFFRGRNMELYVFHARCLDEYIHLNVHTHVLWIEPKRMTEFLFVDEDREIVKKLITVPDISRFSRPTSIEKDDSV